MQIRHAKIEDLYEIMRVYRAAKQYMDDTGNETQWKVGYPSEEMIREDIAEQRLFVITENETVHAAFFFAIGEDPTYLRIYEGEWKRDGEYGVIHRVGSDGAVRGVMRSIVAFCYERIANLRIDTHENNGTMRHVLEALGFARCGIIYLLNGDARIAYQLCE